MFLLMGTFVFVITRGTRKVRQLTENYANYIYYKLMLLHTVTLGDFISPLKLSFKLKF